MSRNRDEVLATYAAYLAAFIANDIRAIDRLVQYLLAYIGKGKTTLVDTFPIKPADLMAAKRWHDTKDSSYEVVFASTNKAHVILRHAMAAKVKPLGRAGSNRRVSGRVDE